MFNEETLILNLHCRTVEFQSLKKMYIWIYYW